MSLFIVLIHFHLIHELNLETCDLGAKLEDSATIECVPSLSVSRLASVTLTVCGKSSFILCHDSKFTVYILKYFSMPNCYRYIKLFIAPVNLSPCFVVI